MPRPIRRVVAGHGANGKAAVVKGARHRFMHRTETVDYDIVL